MFIAPSGVWVVDAKTYKGKLEKRDVGPLLARREPGLRRGPEPDEARGRPGLQLKAVRAALEPDPAYEQIPIYPVLCFVASEWGLLSRPFDVRGVTVLYPGALSSRLKKAGPLLQSAMERIANRLAASLPPASA